MQVLLQVETSFVEDEGGYRDGLERNKGSLHSKVAQSYMTPSLCLCSILNFAKTKMKSTEVQIIGELRMLGTTD